MKVVGLITEYNPFHNGHAYHIQKAKELTQADFCIAVMSGNFVQRGAPAVLDKYTRTRMALESGADLVLELPVPFATGSAEIFSEAAIKLLDGLGIVNAVCFGSECGDLSRLRPLAELFVQEPASYRAALQNSLQKGNSFPKARMEAAASCRQESSLLSSPNNILGIEYLKALIKTGSSISPHTISRIQAGYHSKRIEHPISSATAIRGILTQNCEDTAKTAATPESEALLEAIRPAMPGPSFALLKAQFGKTCPICENDFSLLLNYCLVQPGEFSEYAELSKELSSRLHGFLPGCHTFEEWIDLLKTKAYTRTRICRSLFHLLLNITKSDMEEYKAYGYCLYARALGFRSGSVSLLSEIKKNSSVPLITKIADAKRYLPPVGIRLLEQEIRASHIYRQVVHHKFGFSLPDEYRAGIIKTDDPNKMNKPT